MKDIYAYNEEDWVGFDLDGTISKFDSVKWEEDNNWIGEPYSNMIDQIHHLLKNGIKVKIFTARATRECAIPSVKAWVKEHIGVELEITNVKDFDCVCIIDDIAVGVDFNNSGIHDDITIWTNYEDEEYIVI